MKINIFKANDAVKFAKEAKEKNRIEKMNNIFNKIRTNAALGKESCTIPEIIYLSKEEIKIILSNGYDIYFSFYTKIITTYIGEKIQILFSPKLCWGNGKKELEEENIESKILEEKFLNIDIDEEDYNIDYYQKNTYQNFKQIYNEVLAELG